MSNQAKTKKRFPRWTGRRPTLIKVGLALALAVAVIAAASVFAAPGKKHQPQQSRKAAQSNKPAQKPKQQSPQAKKQQAKLQQARQKQQQKRARRSGQNPTASTSRSRCAPTGVKYQNQRNYDRAEFRKRQFGSPGNNLVTMHFMGEEVRVNERVAPCLQAVENELRAHGSRYNVYRIDSYAPLSAKNSATRYHAYGAAIDINPPENPQCTMDGKALVDLQHRCDDRKPYALPNWWIPVFEKYGFWWGGKYQHSTKDYMHFEFHR